MNLRNVKVELHRLKKYQTSIFGKKKFRDMTDKPLKRFLFNFLWLNNDCNFTTNTSKSNSFMYKRSCNIKCNFSYSIQNAATPHRIKVESQQTSKHGVCLCYIKDKAGK